MSRRAFECIGLVFGALRLSCRPAFSIFYVALALCSYSSIRVHCFDLMLRCGSRSQKRRVLRSIVCVGRSGVRGFCVLFFIGSGSLQGEYYVWFFLCRGLYVFDFTSNLQKIKARTRCVCSVLRCDVLLIFLGVGL